jgi:hypothetical protein
MGRQTRRRKSKRTSTMKSGASGAYSSIEGLHASFDRINNKIKMMLDSGKSDADLARAIRTAWSEQFHSILSDTAIHGMVVHFRKIHKGQKGGSSLALNQTPQLFEFRGGSTSSPIHSAYHASGGSSLNMAPLGAEMSQGTTTPVYGEFPIGFTGSPESGAMVKALDLGRFYESDVGRSCDSTGGQSAPQQTGGSPAPQQTGGSFWDALLNGAPLRSVPPNTVELAQDAITATRTGFPSSDPVSGSVALQASNPTPFDVGNVHSFSQLSSVISK